MKGKNKIWVFTGVLITATVASNLFGPSFFDTSEETLDEEFSEVVEPDPWACDSIEYNGYMYDLVQIGNQCWFAENLRTLYHGPYGHEPIDYAHNRDNNLSQTSNSYYSYYMNNDSTGGAPLYNWYSCVDERGLCPPGWDVPSDEEFMELEQELGMSGDVVHDTQYRGGGGYYDKWAEPTPAWVSGANVGSQLKGPRFGPMDGSNKSGFNAVPAGSATLVGDWPKKLKFYEGHYTLKTTFWTKSRSKDHRIQVRDYGTHEKFQVYEGWVRVLQRGNAGVGRFHSAAQEMYPVRCLRIDRNDSRGSNYDPN